MPRPKSLTAQQIATAALTLMERDGSGALSMRSVADELGVGTMSLYRYVKSREQLEDLVVALFLDGVPVELPAKGAWPRRITIMAERVRDAIDEHPTIVPLLVARAHSAPGLARWIEGVLSLLAEAGFANLDRAIAVRALVSYVIGAVQLEHLAPIGERAAQFADLPKDAFPLVLQAAEAGRRLSPDEEFRKGLAIIVRGLESGRAS